MKKRRTRAERQRRKREKNKAEESGTGNGSRTRLILVATILAVVVLFSAYMLGKGESLRPITENPGIGPDNPGDQGSSEKLNIPQNQIGSESELFTHTTGGVDVRFFAVRGSDGKARVALDACDLCYSAKKGYQQEANLMRCRNCGRAFAIDSIGTENKLGGCWPSYLPMTEEGDQISIKSKDIGAKSYMFR